MKKRDTWKVRNTYKISVGKYQNKYTTYTWTERTTYTWTERTTRMKRKQEMLNIILITKPHGKRIVGRLKYSLESL